MTAEETRSEAEAEQGASPFVAPAYAIREVPFDAPYSWLAAGWRDMWRVPRVSLAYGAIFAVTGLVLAVGLTQVGLLSLILVLAAGFILVGPMLAAGLYETSLSGLDEEGEYELKLVGDEVDEAIAVDIRQHRRPRTPVAGRFRLHDPVAREARHPRHGV